MESIPRALCDICSYQKRYCNIKEKRCPCKLCLIKSICLISCEKARKYFNMAREVRDGYG